ALDEPDKAVLGRAQIRRKLLEPIAIDRAADGEIESNLASVQDAGVEQTFPSTITHRPEVLQPTRSGKTEGGRYGPVDQRIMTQAIVVRPLQTGAALEEFEVEAGFDLPLPLRLEIRIPNAVQTRAALRRAASEYGHQIEERQRGRGGRLHPRAAVGKAIADAGQLRDRPQKRFFRDEPGETRLGVDGGLEVCPETAG